jgi:hypothetical protein
VISPGDLRHISRYLKGQIAVRLSVTRRSRPWIGARCVVGCCRLGWWSTTCCEVLALRTGQEEVMRLLVSGVGWMSRWRKGMDGAEHSGDQQGPDAVGCCAIAGAV